MKHDHSAKQPASECVERIYQVPGEGGGLIKFLEDGPYATFLQHRADWMPPDQPRGYLCLWSSPLSVRSEAGGCPLCAIAAPIPQIRMNIVDLGGPTPLNKVFQCGLPIRRLLERYALDAAIGPLSGQSLYFAVSAVGDQRSRRWQLRPTKFPDLPDGSRSALSAADITSYQQTMWDGSTLRRSTRTQLQDVAAQALIPAVMGYPRRSPELGLPP